MPATLACYIGVLAQEQQREVRNRRQQKRLRQTLVWLKDRPVLGHGDFHYQHEPILYGVARPTGRWGRGEGSRQGAACPPNAH